MADLILFDDPEALDDDTEPERDWVARKPAKRADPWADNPTEIPWCEECGSYRCEDPEHDVTSIEVV